MRRTKAAWVLGAALALVSSQAAAQQSYKGGGDKGDAATKGTKGTEEASPQEPAPTNADSTLTIQRTVDTTKKAEQTKPWEVGASFETHRMFVQDDGSGVSKVFNTWAVFALYRFTEHDTIGLQEFFTEGFLVDPGESGTEGADPALTVSHSVSLPRDFLFSATGSISAPISVSSQKSGLITAPHLSLSLNKKLGRYINVSAHMSGGLFIARYAEQEGGGTNPLADISGGLSAEVEMPFYEPLSFGMTVNDRYGWFYNVQSSDQSVVQNGVVADATYPNQPVFQQYGGEIYGRWTLPTLAGAKSDFTLTVGDGDPSLAYNSYLHDGIGYTYLFYRLTGEVYGALTVRY